MTLVNKTFSQLITFTRASSATFVGSNGLIQSATTNTPRFDYNPVTLAAKGLLIEEQRTNLLTYSEQFDNAAWVKTGATVSANAATSPDGSSNADTLVEDTSTGTHRVFQAIICSANTAYTFTAFIKAAGRTQVQIFETSLLGASFDLSNGTVSSTNPGITSSIDDFGNGWYRCRISVTTGAAQTSFVAQIRAVDSGGSSSYTGNGAASLNMYGAQLEAGSFPTSYIPTVASQVTRSADVASVNTLSPWYNATEGTFYAEFQTLFSGILDITRYVLLADASASKRIIYLAAGQQLAQTFDGTTVINAPGDVTGPVAKVASAYTTSARDIVSNGGTVANGTSVASYPATSLIAISVASNTFCGHIRRITYYKRRLSNADLQSITL